MKRLLRLDGSSCKPVIRCLLGVLEAQVADQGGEDRCRVLGPARHANIDLGCAAMTVPGEEVAQPDLRQIVPMEPIRQLLRRAFQEDCAMWHCGDCDPPQLQVHLGRHVVRHAALGGVHLAGSGDRTQHCGRDPAREQPGIQRRQHSRHRAAEHDILSYGGRLDPVYRRRGLRRCRGGDTAGFQKCSTSGRRRIDQ
jgi:hypothetical protein